MKEPVKNAVHMTENKHPEDTAKEPYGQDYFLKTHRLNYNSSTTNDTTYNEGSYMLTDQHLAQFIMFTYKPKTVLVLGYAISCLVKTFRDLGSKTVGIDSRHGAINKNSKKAKPYLHAGNIFDLNFLAKEACDVTIALDSFGQIPTSDIHTAIHEAARVTRDCLLIDVQIEEDDPNSHRLSIPTKIPPSVYSVDWWIRQFLSQHFRLDGKQVYSHPEGHKRATLILRKQKSSLKDKCAPKEERKQVDIIVLNYNGIHLTPKCIELIYRYTKGGFRVIVVDNKSTDGSAEWLKSAKQRYSNMTVHFNKEPDSGYAAGINTGLKYSKASYVCLLNNDVFITQKNWLSLLISALERNPTRGIVSPKLLYPDGRIQYGGATFNSHGQFYHIGRFKPHYKYNVEREIPAATFACVLIRREILKEGLDEAYLVGNYEDVDFCTKARFNGYSVWYCPKVTLYHYESATQSTRYQPQYLAQMRANASLYYKRWMLWLQLNMQARPEVYVE